MGFFSAIFDAAKETNDDAHGARLLEGVQSSFSSMETLDDRVQHVAMKGYLQIQERLIAQMPNWSREKRIELGRIMQRQAREAFDGDMAGGHAKWLAGAWLESNERNSLKAQQAHDLLDAFADHIRNEVK
jgi:hypothetical protein